MKVAREVRMGIKGKVDSGKTALVFQYITGVFQTEHLAYDDSYRKVMELDQNTTVMLDIYDSTDSEFNMRDRYWLVVQGVLLVYSVTDRSTFDALFEQYDSVRRQHLTDLLPAVVVANKCDLPDRVVSSEEGYQFARGLGFPYYETSAKSNANVKEVFANLAMQIINHQATLERNRKMKKSSLFSRKQKKEAQKFTPHVIPKAKLYSQVNPKSIIVPQSSYVSDMQQLYEDMDFSDITFISSDGKAIAAHRFVIAARCKELATFISQQPKGENIVLVLSSVVFQSFLKYLYTGILDESVCNDVSSRQQLLEAARCWSMAYLLQDMYNKYEDLQPNEGDPRIEDQLLTKSEASQPVLNREMRRALVASSSDKSGFDVSFLVTSDGRRILAHKAMLSARCAYFRAMFTGGTKERTMRDVDMNDVSSDMLLRVIEYCYTDDIRYISDDVAVDVLITASKFCLTRLKNKMEEYIFPGVTRHNVLQVYNLAREYDARDLQASCQFLIAKWMNSLSKGDDFHTILTPEEVALVQEMHNKSPHAADEEASELAAEAKTAQQVATTTPPPPQQQHKNTANRCLLQ